MNASRMLWRGLRACFWPVDGHIPAFGMLDGNGDVIVPHSWHATQADMYRRNCRALVDWELYRREAWYEARNQK